MPTISYFTTQNFAAFVLAFIAGICFACNILWATPLIFVAFICCYQQSQSLVQMILITCFFFFGSTRYYQQHAAYFEHSQLLEKNCNICATVQEILPRLDEQEDICIVLRATKIAIKEIEHKINKNIYLYLPFYTKLWIKPGQKIEAKNLILKHPCATSFQDYLIREDIWAVAHNKYFSYTTVQRPSHFAQHLHELCTLPLYKAKNALSPLTHSLYISVFCGKKIKSPATTKIKRLFAYWGISHHLARSGLHLMILINLLLFLITCIPCSMTKKQWVILSMLFCYYYLTYPSVAFIRTFYMYALYSLCKRLWLPSNPLHILIIATLTILIFNPYHIFFLDFQLSFGITLLILWFCQIRQNGKTVAL